MQRLAILVVTIVLFTIAGVALERSGDDGPAAKAQPASQQKKVAATPSPANAKSPAAEAKRPNVIVVMMDDMRDDELVFSPAVRRFLGERGLRFENSFSPLPLCCPARASFLLGQQAHNHRILSHEPPYGFSALDDSRTIATAMKDAGYQTALIGKYLNGYGAGKSKVTGKDSLHYVPAGWTDWMVGSEHQWPSGSPNQGNTYNYFDFTQNVNGSIQPNPGIYSSKVIGNQTNTLIRKYHQSDAPFFMWVTPVAPHHGGPREPDDPAPYVTSTGSKEKFVTPARPDWVKGMFDKTVTHAFGTPATRPAEADVSDKPKYLRGWPETTPVEKRALTEVERQRAESIYAYDREFAGMIDTLRKTGEYDDTVIMFTSDNGYFLGEHRQRLGKIKPHEPSIKVPFVVAGPGIPHGTRYAPVTTVDLTPTILDIAGGKLPGLDGESLWPVMTGPDRAWRRPVVVEALLPEVPVTTKGFDSGLTEIGLRTGRYKYVRYADGEEEFYDLVKDPNELTNVADRPRKAKLVAQFRKLWQTYSDCKGADCTLALPKNLQTSAADSAVIVTNARRQARSYYN